MIYTIDTDNIDWKDRAGIQTYEFRTRPKNMSNNRFGNICGWNSN